MSLRPLRSHLHTTLTKAPQRESLDKLCNYVAVAPRVEGMRSALHPGTRVPSETDGGLDTA